MSFNGCLSEYVYTDREKFFYCERNFDIFLAISQLGDKYLTLNWFMLSRTEAIPPTSLVPAIACVSSFAQHFSIILPKILDAI